MRNGFCSTPVKVERPTHTRDDYGQVTASWASHVDPLWCAISTRARTSTHAGGEGVTHSVTFTTPWYPDWDLDRTDRIIWDGDTYAVITIHDRNGQRDFLDIEAARVEP